jgi:phospholipid-binding lipoprotein MlaA
MRARNLRLILPAAIAAVLGLSGCAAPRPAGQTAAIDEEFNDPYEETNRAIFGFNQNVDRTVLVPAAKTYRTVVPPPMRQSVYDFLRNLNGPVTFFHDVLQGQVGLAAETFGRLAINTTVGVGGMFDIATRLGIPHHTNDMGITLANYGVYEGPYIMLPVLGPSNPRDLAGMIADSFIDPGDYVAGEHNLWWAALSRSVVSGIDTRSRNIESLEDIERTSLDYYATIRSLFRQRRAAQIRHEQSNLPNPSPVQGSDAGPDPATSRFLAQMPRLREASAR